MSDFNVSVNSPKGNIYDGKAIFLQVPGKTGALGIAPKHTKMVTLLRAGDIVIRREGEADNTIKISDGILQVNRENVEVLVTEAE